MKAKTQEPSESQKFDAVVRKVLSVSYQELQARERKYKQKRARKKGAKASSPASRDSGD
jgi:hypothetical protein